MQTPQAFVGGGPAGAAAGEGSDCASLVEAAGGRVKVVAGDERLLKVTTPPICGGSRRWSPPGWRSLPPWPTSGSGSGRRARARRGVPLVLGGVAIDHPRGLAGHSDGDVVAHALIDAVLGAAGLGDIGSLFPSGDERFRGVSSLELLARPTRRCARRAGGSSTPTACSSARSRGSRRSATRCGGACEEAIGEGEVNVRATTTDRLGFTGRGEGLAAQAVALLERR